MAKRGRKKKSGKGWVIIFFILLFAIIAAKGNDNPDNSISKDTATRASVVDTVSAKNTEAPTSKPKVVQGAESKITTTPNPESSNTAKPKATAYKATVPEGTAAIASTPFMTAPPTNKPSNKSNSGGQGQFRQANDITTPVPKTNYVLNKSSMKFHVPSCRDVKKISSKNRVDYFGTRGEVTEMGYKPCGHCNP